MHRMVGRTKRAHGAVEASRHGRGVQNVAVGRQEIFFPGMCQKGLRVLLRNCDPVLVFTRNMEHGRSCGVE